MLLAFLAGSVALQLGLVLPDPPPSLLSDLALRDFPIATGVEPLYLDGNDWTLSSVDGNGFESDSRLAPVVVHAVVPGDVITDLQRAGLIVDPYFDQALNASADAANAPGRAWRYTTRFRVPVASSAGVGTRTLADGKGDTLLLVFDGVKMPSRVTVDGTVLGHTANQFRRYIFDATSAVTNTGNTDRNNANGTHVLTVEFAGGTGSLQGLPDDEGQSTPNCKSKWRNIWI